MGWTVKNICHALLLTLFFISIEANSKVTFKPSHYDISIVTKKEHFEKDDLTGLQYEGTVQVQFKKYAPQGFNEDFSIVLNTNKKMTIKTLNLLAKKEGDTTATEIDCPNEIKDGKLTLKCSKDKATYTDFDLKVQYNNPFGDDMTGFYRSSYIDSKNQTRTLLTTHFEPIFARDAFPCFDEPHLKSTFQVTLTVPASITSVLSNTKVESSTDGKDIKIYKFKKTDIPMSTYLVAFTASNLKSTEVIKFKSKYHSDDKEKELRTYGREEIIAKKEGELAQNVGKEAIELTTDYLKIGYALQKVDQVGIPDFSAGAMENFGHISFREKSLFYNNVTSSTMTKQSNLLTIVHELIHQWFGNLVTLESWNYIWLNEAFATYLEYVIASKINTTEINSSDWELMKQMVVNEIHLRAFETDGLSTSKPLNNNITDESVIFASFNDIPYSKGAAVLRMWDLSHETGKFQESLQEYMKTRKEGSANPSDLLKAFKAKAKMDEKTFTSWTDVPGYPVVKVVKCSNDSYAISQSRFLWGKTQEKSKYRIPITYTTSNEKNFTTVATLWLEEGNVTVKTPSGSKWIIVNNQQAGYYRVSYGVENWQALAKELKEGNLTDIPDLNRAQLIDDVFSLARSLQENYVNYSSAFDLVDYLKKEKSFIPLKTALNSFEFLRTKLYNESVFSKFQERVLKLLRPHFRSLKSDEKSHIEKLKKVEIARWACSLDDESCLKEAKELYSSNKYKEYPDVQEIVLCTVVRTNKNAWQDIFNKYKNEQDSPLRVMYLTALGCTNDQKTAEEFLKSTLNVTSGIRKQDLMFILTSVYNGNLKNLDVAFSFIEKNFTEIANTYGGINPLGRAIVGIAKKINNEQQCKRLENLVANVKSKLPGKGTEESLNNALQIAKSNCEWNSVKMDGLKEYLNGAHSLASYSFSLLLLCLLFVFQF